MLKDWAIIFDRDGTLIKFVDYISRIEDVSIIEGMPFFLKKLYDDKALLFMHTNQSIVGRGHMSKKNCTVLNNYIIKQLNAQNIFSKILIAFGDPDKLSPKEAMVRKPTTFLVNYIQRKYRIQKTRIIYVGDTDVDLQSAVLSDCYGIGVRFGKSNFQEEKYQKNKKIHFVSNLNELEKIIYSIANG